MTQNDKPGLTGAEGWELNQAVNAWDDRLNQNKSITKSKNDTRYHPNRKVDMESVYLQKARRKLESSGRITSYDTPIDDHMDYELIQSTADDMLQEDASESYEVAKDNDGVDTPRDRKKEQYGY